MSAGMAPVRGALFACVIVLLDAGVLSPETPVSAPGSSFRLRWLSDLGAESTATDRATSWPPKDYVVARVPGAAYVLTIENGSPRKQRRIAADYSTVYGLARAPDGDVVVAADDGAISLWSGLSRESGLSLRWRRDLGERPASVGWDGGDTVWVGTRQDRLIALSTINGETQWSASIGGRAEAPPLPMGDSLFVATKSHTLSRLDASTGKARWKSELPGPANHPPVAAGESTGLIAVATWNGYLLAVGAETGETRWSIELGARLSGAPVATERFVAVATEDGAARAYDLSGEPIWRTEGVAGERTDLLYFQSGEKARWIAVSANLAILDAATGEILDDYPAGAEKEIERRFLDAMLEGRRPYSESEKASILERESFPIGGRLFGQALVDGDNLVFSTEEGWVYWFDSSSLRPLGRYRAGLRASDVPLWAPETVVAQSSEAIFGVDPASGDTRWRRDVGPVTQIVPGETLAVVAEDRIDVLDPRSGARRWSAHGEYRAVAPVDGRSWLAFGRSGTIQAFDAAGTTIGSPVEPVGPIEAVTALGERRWAVASPDGIVAAVAWEESDFSTSTIWRVRVELPVEALDSSGAALVVQGSQRLVALSSIDGSSRWELSLADGETAVVNAHVFLSGESVLRVYEPDLGTLVKELAVDAKPVAAAVVDDAVVWLDASGTAHRASLEGEGRLESADLGDPVSRASFESGIFLFTTNAGEIGLVELVTPGEATLSQPR